MANEQAAADGKQLTLNQLYLKDFSFESPKAPGVFSAQLDARDIVDISSAVQEMDAGTVEVALSVTVKAASGDDTVFLIEVVQAGLFTMTGFTPAERHALLGSVCPGMLYPYVREAVADFTIRGGFPPLLLQAIDFNTLYAQTMQQRAAAANAPPATDAAPQ